MSKQVVRDFIEDCQEGYFSTENHVDGEMQAEALQALNDLTDTKALIERLEGMKHPLPKVGSMGYSALSMCHNPHNAAIETIIKELKDNANNI